MRRARKRDTKLAAIACCVCGLERPRVESRPDGWDAHLDGATLEMRETCSRACREAKGLPERLPGLVLR